MKHYGKYQKFGEMGPYIISIIFILVLVFIGFHGNSKVIEAELSNPLPVSIGIVVILSILVIINWGSNRSSKTLQSSPTRSET